MRSDSQDVGSLYRQHGAEVLNYLARRCPTDAAHDLLQETFLQVVRCGERLETITMPRAWLFGIARNVMARHYRDQRAAGASIYITHETAPSPDPRLPRMREAIAVLPDDLRETLELRLDAELSYEEIARVLDIPIGTVRSRLHHAVRRLRVALTTSETPP